MIKTIPLDYFINLLIGSLFALTGWKDIKEGKIIRTSYFKRSLIFGVAVFLPIGYYLAIFFTHWSWMYFQEDVLMSTTLIVVTGYVLVLILGYLITAVLIKIDGGSSTFVPAGIGVLGILFFSTVFYKRLIYIGTYEEFRGGTATYALSHPGFLISMFIISVYFFIPLIILLNKNLKDSGTLSVFKKQS